MAIERYYDISRGEIDPENLFFSVIERAKEKHILDEKELSYTDAELHKMIGEVARLCGKGYIKEDSARTMLRNIFMILDSRFSPDAPGEILDAVRERRLWKEWEAGTSESLKYFDRTRMNFYHLEHFYYANPALRADFAIRLKNDYLFSNIYTHSFEKAAFTKAFFALEGVESFRTVCERSELLSCECAFLQKRAFDDLLPAFEERGVLREGGAVVYTASLLDAILLSMGYAAFTRSAGLFPEKRTAKDVLHELMKEDEGALCESFLSYLHMAANRYDVSIVPDADSRGENILNVYASRASEENLASLARYLARNACMRRTSEKGLRSLICFA